MRTIKYTTSFKKNFKREKKGQYRKSVEFDLAELLTLLQADMVLPERYRDHALTGNWKDYRDCHIKPDLLLIYQKTDQDELLILELVRLGSHSELDL
jgi:mRNA interferase YafQ